MDEMIQYIKLLRLIGEAEDAILDSSEDLPSDLDPFAVEVTAEHKSRAAGLLRRTLAGEYSGIADEKLLATQGTGYFRKESESNVDDLLEAARERARKKRKQRSSELDDNDETGQAK